VRDYGKAIYMATTTPILLKALEDCIQGHGYYNVTSDVAAAAAPITQIDTAATKYKNRVKLYSYERGTYR
jgi:hypothetical protein